MRCRRNGETPSWPRGVVARYAALVLAASAVPLAGVAAAQETPPAVPETPAAAEAAPAATPPERTPAPFTASLVAYAVVEGVPAGSALLSVETIALPPGEEAATVPNPGPVVIRVREGTVELDADAALVTVARAPVGPLRPADPTPGPAVARLVGPTEQIVLPPGTAARLTNPTTRPAALTVISLTAADTVAATPAADVAGGGA